MGKGSHTLPDLDSKRIVLFWIFPEKKGKKNFVFIFEAELRSSRGRIFECAYRKQENCRKPHMSLSNKIQFIDNHRNDWSRLALRAAVQNNQQNQQLFQDDSTLIKWDSQCRFFIKEMEFGIRVNLGIQAVYESFSFWFLCHDPSVEFSFNQNF